MDQTEVQKRVEERMPPAYLACHRENGVASNCDGEEGDFGGAEHLNIFLMLKLRYLLDI